MNIKPLQIKPRQFLVGVIATSFVVVFSALLIFVTNSPLKQSQDVRKQAAIPDKNTTAEIKITPAATSIKVGEQSNFVISGSTGGSDTYGFQFVALLDTTNIESVSLAPNVQDNLVFPVATVTPKSATQSEIVIFATNPNITSPVNISGFQDLATLSFKAKSVGNISLLPQDSASKVLAFTGSSSFDLLKPMSGASITITANSQPPAACTKELKICPDGTKVGRDSNNNCEFTPCPTIDATPTPTPTANPTATPTPTPTATPVSNGVGGYVVQACGGTCSSNNECAANLVCYGGECRNPLNVQSSTCANPSVAQTTTSSCNQGCASNNDCDVNLRCYRGVCRSATNPQSPSCDPTPPKPTAAPTSTPRPSPTKWSNLTDTAIKATEKATVAATAASPTPAPTSTPNPAVTEKTTNQSALGAVKQYISDFWKTGNRTQVVIVIGLAVLMIVGLIALLFSLLNPKQPKQPPHRTPPPTMPPPTLTMQR